MDEIGSRYDRQENIVLIIFYALLAALTLTTLLFLLIPFYLSGFNHLSVADIEWSNLWLREAKLYPPLPLDGDIMAIVGLTGWLCAGFPLVLGLWAETLTKFRRLTVGERAGRMVILISATLALVLVKLSSDQLGALLFD
ncbi:MAG TPA: hypothetical protein VM409_07495 [Chloroflexia bacterium]|nr:hypothetical protein [Chloroflexia bacterium]